MTLTSIEWVRSLPDVGVEDMSLGGNRRRTLHGKAASPGRYAGMVRVIYSEAEFDRLHAGDVLVCPVVLRLDGAVFPCRCAGHRLRRSPVQPGNRRPRMRHPLSGCYPHGHNIAAGRPTGHRRSDERDRGDPWMNGLLATELSLL
jgi:hypothetical protein